MLLRPNLSCLVTSVEGHDQYGKEILGETNTSKCAVVRLEASAEKTSVRSDSSASGGYAEERKAIGRLLFPHYEDVALGYKIQLLNLSLRVLSVFPRFSLDGKPDHLQVDVAIWADGKKRA
jgi:hypothetical protein